MLKTKTLAKTKVPAIALEILSASIKAPLSVFAINQNMGLVMLAPKIKPKLRLRFSKPEVTPWFLSKVSSITDVFSAARKT